MPDWIKDRPAYYALLLDAADASNAVDNFDLHSEDPASIEAWEKLQLRDVEAQTALMFHILSHAEDARELLGAFDDQL
jgi:hypothetical protein